MVPLTVRNDTVLGRGRSGGGLRGGRRGGSSRGRRCRRAWDTNAIIVLSPQAAAVFANFRVPLEEIVEREGAALLLDDLVTRILRDGHVERGTRIDQPVLGRAGLRITGRSGTDGGYT